MYRTHYREEKERRGKDELRYRSRYEDAIGRVWVRGSLEPATSSNHYSSRRTRPGPPTFIYLFIYLFIISFRVQRTVHKKNSRDSNLRLGHSEAGTLATLPRWRHFKLLLLARITLLVALGPFCD